MESVIETTPRPETRVDPATRVDARALGDELRQAVEGEVRFEDGDRALYATDAGNYRQVPIGVVIPRTVEDVVRTVAVARRHRAPVLPRGCGTSLAGQCCNMAVVLDFSKYLDRVLEINPERRTARVLPGTILDHLRDEARSHGLDFGPDPATHKYCTIGGMLGNNSCGVHSVLSEFYGPGPRMEDHVQELEILTYDGVRMRVGPTPEDELERIIRSGGRQGQIYAALRDLRDRYARRIRAGFPDIPRRVSGYNLPALLPENGFNVAAALVGTEGTCVTILEATLSLDPFFPARSLVLLGYPSVYEAGDHVPEIRRFRPVGIEGMDDLLVGYMRKKGLHAEEVELLPEGGGWLLVEFGGETREEASRRARAMMDALARQQNPPTMKRFDDPAKQTKVWEIRESGLGATAFVPDQPDTWPGWEDSAVPPDRVGDYLRDLRGLFHTYGYTPSLYGHFGQGCIHTRVDFELDSADGVARYRAFTREAAELAARTYGGSLSGEHGDGQARGDLLPVMYDDETMEAFRRFRRIWDPDAMMNPGKAVDALPRDEVLRLGPHYHPATPTTHFQYPADHGSFAHATLRCVGVGKCRRLDTGTMCPSFQVLREEKHTTRGRTHLLFEMLQGDVVDDGWKSEAVKEALDLCLACKGCKGECPVNVDVASYKAEFLSHYYDRRLRPRSAYAFGLIHQWARIASRVPGLANFMAHAPLLRTISRAATGMTPEREPPAFAATTFTDWFRGRPPQNVGGPRVILWPDTFNNHFFPGTLQAGLEVLEDAGYHVVVPEGWLCCGRPLYDYGMLGRAKALWRRTIAALRDEIEAAVPLVGLEPSCVSAFRDELANLLPHDADARRLERQTYTLGEFLTKEASHYRPPRLRGRAVVHGHCHHKSVMDLGPEEAVLRETGLDVQVLDSGCCGLAGSFGYETGKYDVSMGAGERVLLPAVRGAARDTLLVADGFSCREQIAHGTPRRALHLAEALQLARALDGGLPDGSPPELLSERMADPAFFRPAVPLPTTLAVLGAGAALAAGLLAWRVGSS